MVDKSADINTDKMMNVCFTACQEGDDMTAVLFFGAVLGYLVGSGRAKDITEAYNLIYMNYIFDDTKQDGELGDVVLGL